MQLMQAKMKRGTLCRLDKLERRSRLLGRSGGLMFGLSFSDSIAVEQADVFSSMLKVQEDS